MKKYILIDNFEGIETHNVCEETLRDLYNKLMDELLWNWKDCGDANILKGLIEEKYNVYKVDIKQVINAIIDIDGHYEIKEDKEYTRE